jgi:hypothetical protein
MHKAMISSTDAPDGSQSIMLHKQRLMKHQKAAKLQLRVRQIPCTVQLLDRTMTVP